MASQRDDHEERNGPRAPRFSERPPERSGARRASDPPGSIADSIALALRVAEESWLAVQLARGMGLYFILWLSALCTDAILYLHVGIEHPGRMLAARLLPLPLMAIGYARATSRGRISQGEAQRWALAIDLLTTLWIALVAHETGGPDSPAYVLQMFGATSMLVMPMPWRYALFRHVVVYVTFVACALFFYAPVVAAGHGTWEVRDHVGFVIVAMCVHAFSASLVYVGNAISEFRHRAEASKNVGRYELRRRIGRGGMGEVWAAWHTGMRREVALKLVRVDRELTSDLARRFEREVQSMVRLRHPNTVRVFDFGSEPGGLLYYAMELLEGEHLGAIVANEGLFPVARAYRVALEVARALAEAHANGIVHRDVKPENIFLARAGGESDLVKVLDFGIAFVVAPGDERLTHDDMIAGTPSTISPEVLLGHDATPASDVYALGCVLYFLLAGAMPFGASKSMAVFEAHLRQVPVPPAVRRGTPIPEALEALVLRCLAKDPAERPADAGAVVAALVAIDAAALVVESPRVGPAIVDPDARTIPRARTKAL